MQKKKNWKKSLKYAIAGPLLRVYLDGLLRGSRRQAAGLQHLDALIAADTPFIPCYWHQQNLL